MSRLALSAEPVAAPQSALSARAAVLLGMLGTAWSLLFRGFEGGRWSDIPIIKSFVNPELYTRDPFIYSLHSGTPAAYTYQFIAAIVGLLPGLPIEGTLFLLYLPVCVASLALLYLIGFELVGDRLSVVLFLALYVAGFRLLTVGSTILHSAELTPAFLALPLQLGALYALLRERHALTGALAGLALNVHAPTSSYVGAAIGLVYVLGIGRHGLRTVALAGTLMVLCGAPAMIGAVGRHADPLPGWALQLARIELATDLSLAVNWDRAASRLRNLFGLALLATAMLAVRGDRHRRTVLLLFGAVALLCVIAFIFIDLTLRGPISTLVARLQLPRSAWLVNVVGLIYVAHYLRCAWTTERLPRLTILVLVAAMLAAPSDFTPLEPIWLWTVALVAAAEALRKGGAIGLPRLRYGPTTLLAGLTIAGVVGLGAARLVTRRVWVLDFDHAVRAASMATALLAGWLLWRLLRGRLDGRAAVAAGLAVALVGSWAVRGSTDWLYELRHRGGLSAAAEFQAWARAATPVDSVFLILPSEPNNESFYKNADRALYLVRERANQAVYFTEHNYEFRDRVVALGVSDVLRYREELDPMYRRLTEERVRDLASRFGVTHFVPARAGDFSFPIVYQQGGWTVYAVSGQ
ncbi:MAG: hypothetical protein H0V51_06790 [Chloroflexi bacterium]|nr:hypothetical protein [Chloroflexota bacterium]